MPGYGLREVDEKLVEVGLKPPLRLESSRLELFFDEGVESDLDRPVEDSMAVGARRFPKILSFVD